METRLPIRFLETPTCGSIIRVNNIAYCPFKLAVQGWCEDYDYIPLADFE
jgi:hypothetical protein